MANINVRKSIQTKIESLTKEIENLQSELVKWEKIASEYEVNSESIDLILSIQQPEKTEGGRAKKIKQA
ncbi:hypothetical protein EV200_11141 [Pedobacter psychrotolerans]|uniref:Uncharacterized protein n=1 Tax=Pedobacter psychrotolerans TaxID=1843235 RepID=A0A4R2H2A5_9SPHI|nr:hypothetical protein [Pedobacter psychrotolerans]TCO18704.1 hypothetical protein EV200_11141 [Pedobacter psychrotolerans]GGE70153.1 hypothetical protein GCM10011413_41010 [Pedobacter psychrotolerans]